MKPRILFSVLILPVLMISPSLILAQGQDPGIPDTVRFDDGVIPLWVGSAPIPVRFTADESLR